MIVITGNGMGNRIFAWNLGNIISNNTLAITVIPKQNTPRYLWLYEIYIYICILSRPVSIQIEINESGNYIFF